MTVDPTAPPLLLHGGRDHCRNWDWVAQRLRDRWHVVAPDLRGHGFADAAHWVHHDQLDAFMKALTEFLYD